MGIAAGMKVITQDIVSSHEDRMKRIGEIREEVNQARGEAQSLMIDLEASHEEMSQELRKGLAQGEAERKQTSAKLKTDLVQGVTNLKSEVNGMRNGFQTSHNKMGTQLRKDLAQGAAACKSEVKGILNDFRKSRQQTGVQLRKELAAYDRGIESEVAGIRQETRGDLREARTAWQGLASTMPAKRSGAEIPQEAETLAAEETIDLEAKMLAAVNEHPEGMTLADVADSLGVAPVVLGRAVKSLVDKAEIRKEEKLYFPVSAE